MATSGAGSDMYFHCFIKVCPIADEATCSTTLLDGTTAVSCTSYPVNVPARRRRDNFDGLPIDFTAKVVKVRIKIVVEESVLLRFT